MACGEQVAIMAGVTLRRGYVGHAAATMLFVVPVNEAHGPFLYHIEIGEPLTGNSGRYLAVWNKASAYGLSSLTR